MGDSYPPVRKLAVITLLATAAISTLGGAVANSALRWWGGIATVGDVERDVSAALSACAKAESVQVLERRAAELETRLGDVEARTSVSLVQRIGLETRARVGLQVALARGLDPRRKREAEDSAAIARAKFDELVLRGATPADAAERVLELMRVPR